MKVLQMPYENEFTHNEAAAFLGIRPATLYRKLNDGTGPRVIRRFGRLHYLRADLEKYKKANEQIREAYSG